MKQQRLAWTLGIALAACSSTSPPPDAEALDVSVDVGSDLAADQAIDVPADTARDGMSDVTIDAAPGPDATDSGVDVPLDTAHDVPSATDACAAPTCGAVGTRSEGWYACDGTRIRWTTPGTTNSCAGCTPRCLNVGSFSEGWYDCTDALIVYAICH